MLVLIIGLPGTGKSTLARALASILPTTILDRDKIRDAVFPLEDLDYSEEQNEIASQITYKVAEHIFNRNKDRNIILDGRPYSKRAQIKVVEDLAKRVGHCLKVIYCWAPDEVVRKRLEQDMKDLKEMQSVRTFDKYLRIKMSFNEVKIDHIKVDTSIPFKKVIELVIEYLKT